MNGAGAVSAASLAGRRAALGMWVFLATELMFFGPLFFGYGYGRLAFPDAFAAASRHTEVLLGGINTAVLLVSSALMACAVDALEAGKARASRRLLLATATLGAAFLAIKGIEYAHDIERGLLPGGASPLDSGGRIFFLLYYAMTGVHAVHLLIGVGVALAFGFGGGRVAALSEPGHLRVAGLYWHFVDAIWIFLYPILYLVGRSG
ncbi:MAG TPA: cytochrome c oxidase subunit 3 [Rhodocyclaceae bacterium]